MVSSGRTTDTAKDATQKVQDSAAEGAEEAAGWARYLGRAGIAAQGVTYLVLAWITGQVALGGGSGEQASTSGALQQLADQPFGFVLLLVLAAGFLAYAAWQGFEVVGMGFKPRPETSDRLQAAGKAVFGLILLGLVISVLAGSGSSGGDTNEQAAGTLLSFPGGRVLVGLVGLAVVGFGGYVAYQGWSGKITKKLGEGVAGWLVWLGRVGDVARGLAFATIGVLFGLAAWRGQSEEAGGMDQALAALRNQPFGTGIVLSVALGFAAWGIYNVLTAHKHVEA